MLIAKEAAVSDFESVGIGVPQVTDKGMHSFQRISQIIVT